ncbi:MAG: hypothetical protein KDA24_04380 [Deltaproteobacteria bacterium]|nr:hypothetical protein [Deltaproteobacteria bacterium]
MRPMIGRLTTLALLCGSLAIAGVAHGAASGTENPASGLVGKIDNALGEIDGMIAGSSDPTKLNCLNTEKGLLTTYKTDADGIKANIDAANNNQNNDQVDIEKQKIIPLETNVDSAISRANSCKGAKDLGEGSSMSVTVSGGDSSDRGDDNFGASPDGSTRTEEASQRD